MCGRSCTLETSDPDLPTLMNPHTAIIVAAVAALLVGPAKVMGHRAFWRSAAERHPATALTLVFVIVVPLLGFVTLRFFPTLAGWIGAVVLGAVALAAFLGRPDRGRRAGWPPGSLGWWGSVLSLVDTGEYARRAARHGCVFKIRQMHRPTVCVVDLVEGTRLLREHRSHLGPATLPYDDVVPGGFVRFLRGDEHRARRAGLQSSFSRRAVGEMEPSLRSSVRAGVRLLADETPWHPSSIERPLLHTLVVAYLGPEASGALRDATADHARALASYAPSALRALVADLLNNPSPPSVMATLKDRHKESDERDMLVANAAFTLHLGWRDLSGFATWLVAECARRPDVMADVRGHPERAAHIVEETLRLRQSEYLYRKATEDIAIDDFAIPRGWLVRVCVREAHRSPEHFRDPATFDATRFDEGCPHGTPPAERFQPFGVDHHACLGADLSRTIGRLLVEELATYDLSVDTEAPAAAGGRHWRHLAPGRRMRVRLKVREARSPGA